MTTEALRLLHVTQPTDYGVGRYVGAIAQIQAQNGHEVVVACPAASELADHVVRCGVSHRSWRATRKPGPSLGNELAGLRRIVDEVDPDVIHLHSSKAGLVGRLLVRGACPTMFQPHAWSFHAGSPAVRRMARRFERVAAAWADVVVCGSQGELDQGRRAGVPARWCVVPNAVDVEHHAFADDADRRAAQRTLGLPDVPLVVCVGRLCHQKGQDLLLRAWPSVRDVVPGAQLVLVGAGPDEGPLRATAGPDVCFAGPQDDVRPWLRAADVVVQPSRYETMALSMLEAMSVGRSVVATDVEGALEALGSGPEAAGAVVPLGDDGALASALITRLLDQRLAAEEGQRGRTRVVARHSVAAAVTALTDTAAALAAQAQGRRHRPLQPAKGST